MNMNTNINVNMNTPPAITEISEPVIDHFFKTKEQVVCWLEEMGIQNYTILKNLMVNVAGGVDIKGKKMDYLPVEFGEVEGDFLCSDCNLLSFKGTPIKIKGGFYARANRVKTLEGGPEIVRGDYHVQKNQLESLKGLPEKINLDLSISDNNLRSFEYMSKTIGLDLFCCNNPLPLQAFSELDFNVKGDIVFTPPTGMNVKDLEEYIDEDDGSIWMNYAQFKKHHHALLLKEKIEKNLPALEVSAENKFSKPMKI
jgi:hypothetical protein